MRTHLLPPFHPNRSLGKAGMATSRSYIGLGNYWEKPSVSSGSEVRFYTVLLPQNVSPHPSLSILFIKSFSLLPCRRMLSAEKRMTSKKRW